MNKNVMNVLVALALLFVPCHLHAQSTGGESPSSSSPGAWVCWSITTENPCHLPLRSVDMVSGNEAWAVGDLGAILHWVNGRWTVANSPTSRRLNAVTMVSARNGWAVGENGTILHYQRPSN